MRSITLKLVLSFLLVILVGIGLVALAAGLGARGQFATYLQQGPTIVRLDRAVASLASYYVQNGGWDRVQGLVESTASAQAGRLILTDGHGNVLADSSRLLNGQTIDEASQGETSSIFMGSTQVGLVHFVALSDAGRPWWDVLGLTGRRSGAAQASGAQAPPTGGQTGMMGGGMMGSGAGHMSPGSMGQMMGSWQSPSSVVGPSEQEYLSGFNGALWLGGLGAALVALGLAVFSARRITRPLRRLAEASARIAGGDLTQRVEVPSKDELGELASSFNSMAEALARNEEARRHMVTDIAHELRTPLTVLQGNLEGMLDGVVPLSKDTVATLHQETHLLSRLISDLRELSLAESGRLELHRVPTDLPALVKQAANKMVSQARAKDISLDTQVPPALPYVDLDPDRISQILANLLSNALRHTPNGGRIVLTLEEAPDGNDRSVRISVADTGSGIPPEDLPYVFDRFYRADRSRSRSTGGSGLGLAIVKQLVQAHGGRIWVESQPGRGAAFYFTLPVRQAAPRKPSPIAS